MQKTFSFAVVHFSVAFLVTFALTGDILVGGVIALVEPIINTLAFHAHETLWNRLKFNKSTSSNTLTA